MAVPIGRLLVQNYRLISGTGETGPCELAESSRYWMDVAHPGRVDPLEPIHSVADPSELAQRAVSIHIYSHPYDSCQVYFLEQKRSLEVPLHYASKFGVLGEKEKGAESGVFRTARVAPAGEDDGRLYRPLRFFVLGDGIGGAKPVLYQNWQRSLEETSLTHRRSTILMATVLWLALPATSLFSAKIFRQSC